ncbi:hypothetical protein [Streptomyces subrutilus]|uniref:hypothetical protein n=1 Tax=Streptomyces subrutilus TaxID=36818 RepID=UPI0033F7C673
MDESKLKQGSAGLGAKPAKPLTVRKEAVNNPSWSDEIFSCGNLPQENIEETAEEGARLWERYVRLADEVVGDEGTAGVASLIRSLRVEEDFGAYQSSLSALQRFPRTVFGTGVAKSAATLADIPECWSGNVLLLVVRLGQESTRAFNDACAGLGVEDREKLERLIDFHESNEWLAEDEDRGKLILP